MARTVEAILKANTGGFDSAIAASTAKLSAMADAAARAGARIDTALAGSARSASKVGSAIGSGVGSAAAPLAKATESTTRFGKAMDTVGRNSAGITKAGNAAGKAGLLLAVGVGIAVKSAADFDQAMSGVQATGADAAGSMDKLRASAIKAGNDTQYSAKQAANAEEELLKAGVSAADVYGGALKGSLDLAAAGGLAVADAANIAATAMVQFGKNGSDVGHIADLLAAGAGKAQGSVQDLGLALNYVGPVAASMGISIEQTTGVLAEFANAGLVGEKGGTALRGVLLSLVSPSQVAAKAMKQYGIDLYDSQGAFIGVDGAAQVLHDSLTGLTEAQRNAALGAIFGNAQITAATVLYKGGAGAVNEWTAKVNDAGFAARTAATKMDNLKGDVEKLSGSLQTAFIQSGESAQGGLRGIVQGVDGLVKKFNDLPGAAKSAGLGVAAIGAGALLGLAGLAKLAVGMSEARTAMSTLRSESPKLAGALGAAGKAVTVLAVALAALEVAGAAAKAFHGVLVPNLDEANKSLTALAKTGQATDLNAMFTIKDTGSFGQAVTDTDSLGSAFRRIHDANWGDKLNQQIDSFLGTTETTLTQLRVQFDGLDQSLIGLSSAGHAGEAQKQFAELSKTLVLNGATAEDLITLFPQYAESVKAAAAASGVANLAGQDLADAMGGKLTPALEKALIAAGKLPPALASSAVQVAAFGTAMESVLHPTQLTAEQMSTLSGELFKSGNAFQNAASSHSTYAASLDAAKLSTKKHETALSSHSLAIDKDTGYLKDNTDKQRAAADAIGAVASNGKAYVQSLVAQGASSKEAAAATQTVRDQFIKAADAAGLSTKAAGKLADSYGLIPDEVTTTFQAFGLALQEQQVKDYGNRILALPKKQQSEILAIYKRDGAKAALAELTKLEHTKAKPKVEIDSTNATTKAASIQTALKKLSAPVRAKVEAVFKREGADAAIALLKKLGFTVTKPKITADPSKAVKAANEVTKALQTTGRQHPKPTIATPSSAPKKKADDTTAALKITGRQHAKPIIDRPSTQAQQTAERATAALKTTGRQHANPKITASSNAGSVAGSAQRSINGVHGKSVSVIVHYSSTGSVHEKRAEGGTIGGYSPNPKADNVPIMATAGEFMQPVSSVDYYGRGAMEAIRTRRVPRSALAGYADGGEIGGQRLADGGSVLTPADTAVLVKMIAALSNPLAQVAAATRTVAAAQRAYNAEAAKIAAPRATLNRTAATLKVTQTKKADDQADLLALRKHADALKKRADATKGVTAADRTYKKAQAEVTAQVRKVAGDTLKVTAATKAHTAAQAAFTKVSAAATAASDKLKAAEAARLTIEQAIADNARQISAQLVAVADTTSTDPLDVLQKRNETTKETLALNKQLVALRKAGLNDTDIQGIIGRGALDGGELAGAILKGGKGLIDALNLAQKNLTKAADAVGFTGASGVVKRAGGGWIPGSGGVDSVRTLTTPKEFVTNPESANANAGLLELINRSGRSNIAAELIRGAQVYGGGSSTTNHYRSIAIPVSVEHMGSNDTAILGKIQGRFVDALTMTGLAGVTG